MVADHLALESNALGWRQDPRSDMDTIERALAESSIADDDSLNTIAGHLVAAGGPRLRPAFVAASGLAATGNGSPTRPLDRSLVLAGVSVEMVHLGTLYHDDVIDDAATRDGLETVNHRWGNLKAILAGDFLLARASEVAATLGTEIAETLAETIGWICEGQARELRSVDDLTRTEADYFETIRVKTAALFATACRIGGLVSGLDKSTTSKLASFGRAYGFAYQILDDVAEFEAIEPGNDTTSRNADLRSGVITLPTIRYMASKTGDDLGNLVGPSRNEASVQAASRRVADSGVIQSCVETARAYSKEAMQLLDEIKKGPAVEGLRATVQALTRPLGAG